MSREPSAHRLVNPPAPASRNSRTRFKNRTRFETQSRTRRSTQANLEVVSECGAPTSVALRNSRTRFKDRTWFGSLSHVGTHAMRLAGRQPNQVREFRTRAAHFETIPDSCFELRRRGGQPRCFAQPG